MIVLSLILVIVAAVTLIAGIFQSDSLLLIYVSIGACVGAMVLLGVGVLARRRTTTPATEGGYGPGATSAPVRPAAGAPTRPTGSATAVADRDTAEREDRAAASDDTVIVKKAAPEGARKVTKKAVAKKTVARSAVRPEETTAAKAAEPAAAETPATKSASKKSSKKSAAKKSSKKSAAKKSAAKKSPKKTATTSASKKSSKKSTKKSAAKKTTGADARAVLAAVPGVGPAKQDALLKAFGSLEDIKTASEDEVTAVPGIGPAAAKKIQKHLK